MYFTIHVILCFFIFTKLDILKTVLEYKYESLYSAVLNAKLVYIHIQIICVVCYIYFMHASF